MNKARDLIRLMRPHQWVKNVFVFTGVIFGKEFDNFPFLLSAVMAALSFSFVSSAIYIFNDIADIENDRHHPKKRLRPLAAGTVSMGAAKVLAAAVGAIGLFFGWMTSWIVLFCVITYAVLNIFYSLKLKHVVILDVFCISAGFMLRILAGTAGLGIVPSKWLLLCGLMMTLFLGFAKRRAELLALGDSKEEHRKVLRRYGAIFLDEIIGICATSVIIGYSLYTMSPDTIKIHGTEDLMYTVPFVIYAIFRYIYILHHARGAGDPSTDLFRDKHIITSVCCWAVTMLFLLTFKGL